METTRRPHTGRKRNDAAREAILDAAMRLLAARTDGEPLTVDTLAREAGVGKQTIYRWWGSKGEVLLEAMTRSAQLEVPTPDTGSLHEDLFRLLKVTFQTANDSPTAGLLRTLAAEAAGNPHVAELLRDFTAARRAVLHQILQRGRERGELGAGADLDLIVDQVYGLLWYRLLLGHRSFGPDAAERLTRTLIAGNR